MIKLLTIAGSDTLSGGGLQADLRTFREYGITGDNVLTCIVTMGRETEEISIGELPISVITDQLKEAEKQLDAYQGIKVGMLANLETAQVVASFLEKVHTVPIVLDPVLALKESGLTTSQDIVTYFIERLLPLATITTPNLHEAELLSGIEPIDTVEKMILAGKKIQSYGVPYVVVKGGLRMPGTEAIDVLVTPETEHVYRNPKLHSGCNNGAGCTFASSIAAERVNNDNMREVIQSSKDFVYRSIENGVDFMDGLGNVWQKGKC